MVVWIAIGVLVWVLLVAAVLALFKAAARADAAADRALAQPGAPSAARAAASQRSAPEPSPAALARVAQEVRRELAVDQVMVVVNDERAPQRAVVGAVAGLPASLLDASLDARESLAAAVALTGHAVIAPDHGSLARAGDTVGGDAAALPLSAPPGAIAIARLGRGQRLTADDLHRLRAVVARHDVAGRQGRDTQPPVQDQQRRVVAGRDRFARTATDTVTPKSEVTGDDRPLHRRA